MINFLQRYVEEQSKWKEQPKHAASLISGVQSYFKKSSATASGVISLVAKQDEKPTQLEEMVMASKHVLNIPKIGSQSLRLNITRSEVEVIRQSHTPQKLLHDITCLQLTIDQLIEKYISEDSTLQKEIIKEINSWRHDDGFDDGNPKFTGGEKWILMEYIAKKRESRGIPLLPETVELIKSELTRAGVPEVTIIDERHWQ